MLGIVLLILILVALFLICMVFPKAINEYFENNYGGEVWSLGIAIVEGVCLAVCLFFIEQEGFWISFTFMALSYVWGICSSYKKAKSYGADSFQSFLGMLAQVLASGAFAFIIIIAVLALAGVFNSDGKKRRH